MYNYFGIDHITVQVDVNHIFNGTAVSIDILSKRVILISFLDTLTNRFDGINLKLDKVSEYEYNVV